MTVAYGQTKGFRTKRKRRRIVACCGRVIASLFLTGNALASCLLVEGYQLQGFAPVRRRESTRTKTLSHCTQSSSRARLLGNIQRQLRPQPSLSTTALCAASAPLLTTTNLVGNSYMVLLALQFAFQPIVTKAYASKSLIKGTYVFLLDFMRAAICILTLVSTKSWTSATAGWSWREAAMAAGVPSMLYVAQNYFALQAYQNLSAITFNVLNQTKTLSAALWCFLLLGQSLDIHQVGALGILLLAALVMENMIPIPLLRRDTEEVKRLEAPVSSTEKTVPSTVKPHDHLLGGVVPVLLASLLSGLAGALAQGAL
eukprot:scaffold769_cov168-Amphora_coffeaeformis.AAC.3